MGYIRSGSSSRLYDTKTGNMRVAPLADVLRKILSKAGLMNSKAYLHYHLVVVVTRTATINIASRKHKSYMNESIYYPKR